MTSEPNTDHQDNAKENHIQYREKLRLIIVQYFNRDEIRTLCFDLGINYEDLPVSSVNSMVRELILLLGRNKRLLDLINYCIKHRPQAESEWKEFIIIFKDNPNLFIQPEKSSTYNSDPIEKGLIAIVDLLQYPDIRSAITTFQSDFEIAYTKISLIDYFKQLHDDLQDMETTYKLLVNDRERLPEDHLAWEDLLLNEFLLQDSIDKLMSRSQKGLSEVKLGTWYTPLEKGQVSVHESLQTQNIQQLDLGLGYLFRVLDRGLPRINGRLVDASTDLPLDQLVEALRTVLDKVSPSIETQSEIIDQFAGGLSAMTELSIHLESLIMDHNYWQDFDDELRRIEANMNTGIYELQLAWPDIQELANRLFGKQKERWALILRELEEKLDEYLTDNEQERTVITIFQKYRAQASRRFREIDDQLLELVQELGKIGQPINILLRALQ